MVDLNTIEDPRSALMDWLRNDEKQLFAKAFSQPGLGELL